MILDIATFAAHAAVCAPSVHVETLAAIAKTESGFNTLAIGDNTAKRSYSPKSAPEAVKIASELLRQGHSLDLGLMQINSANLRGLSLSVEQAFQPCPSMRAGARVLIDGYKAPPAGQDPQPALIRALSHYNTGNPQRGVSNGYVGRVMYSAQAVIPALRLTMPLAATQAPAALVQQAPAAPVEPPPPPASWDVYGRARAARAPAMSNTPAAPEVLQRANPEAVAPPSSPVLLRLADED